VQVGALAADVGPTTINIAAINDEYLADFIDAP
jgi:hypothetical protein